MLRVPPRWAAPPYQPVHPRLALVRHRGRLYSFCELLQFVPVGYVDRLTRPETGLFQDWWDAILSKAPDVADRAALHCEPRDFEVLDLYACEARGCA